MNIQASSVILPQHLGLNTNLRIHVLLSVQRALLGEIADYMRAVAVNWSADEIAIRVYTDGERSAEERDDFDSGVTPEVTADLPPPARNGPTVTYQFVRCDRPALVPNWGVLVFARKGVQFQQGTPAAG